MTLTCSTYPLTQREQDSIAPRDASLISHDAHVRGRLRMTISNNKSSWKFWDVLYFSGFFFPRGEWGVELEGDKSCQRAIVSQ